ncbi:hypothetical protein ABBQ32_001259 [Trebouxia sp. C0010 RCD-2024]
MQTSASDAPFQFNFGAASDNVAPSLKAFGIEEQKPSPLSSVEVRPPASDFNKEVLTALTSQNVTANRQRLPKSRRPVSARYFCGDWSSLGSLLASENLGGTYDIIISAETIYSLESQQQLFHCIKQAIKPPTGIAYIAAKTYYFGVGGGTTSFKKLLKSDGMLEVTTVATIDEGGGNKREILKLKFPDNIVPYFL